MPKQEFELLTLHLSGDEVHNSEIQILQREIQLLRKQASRVSELEGELCHFRAHRSSGPNDFLAVSSPPRNREQGDIAQLNPTLIRSPQGQRKAANKVNEEWHERFLDCSWELDRVKAALEFWKLEAQRWKFTCRRIQRAATRQGLSNSNQHTEDVPRASSAPTRRSPLRVDPSVSRAADATCGISAKDIPLLAACEARSSLVVQRDELSNVGNQSSRSVTPKKRQDDDSTGSSDISEQQLPRIRQQSQDEIPKISHVKTDQSKAHDSNSSDPIVVKEVNLKRKRRNSPLTASKKSKSVKQEMSSSSPIASYANLITKGAQESMDLDAVSDPLYTPRKSHVNRTQACSTHPAPSLKVDGLARNDIGDSLLGDIDAESSSSCDDIFTPERPKSEGKNMAGARLEAFCREEGEKYATQLRVDIESAKNDSTLTKRSRHNAREVRICATPERYLPQLQSKSAHSRSAHKHVLQPTDANKIFSRTHDIPTSNNDPSIWHHGAQDIPILAEDGENDPTSESKELNSGWENDNTDDKVLRDKPTSLKQLNPDVQLRLDRLLAGPSTDKPPLSNKDVNAVLSKAHRHPPSAPSIEPKQEPQPVATKPTAVGLGAPSTCIKARKQPLSTKTPFTPNPRNSYITPFSKPASKTSKTEPLLRSRPLSHLSLNDFKVNPKHNQGYEHPFKEIVRKQDQRKCLPGCTRLECCGRIFRQMAESGLFKPFHTTRLMASSQEDDDQRMMEDYLGDQTYRLKRMTRKEKAEVLLQAKTKILADHYGRHREVYAREPSPVGYWDVDMPDSQEAAELGRLAEIRNRQKVEERYREAMRQDGLWKFRDE